MFSSLLSFLRGNLLLYVKQIMWGPLLFWIFFSLYGKHIILNIMHIYFLCLRILKYNNTCLYFYIIYLKFIEVLSSFFCFLRLALRLFRMHFLALFTRLCVLPFGNVNFFHVVYFVVVLARWILLLNGVNRILVSYFLS